MELRGNSELFDLLVKNANGLAIFTLDADGRIASWNESAEKLLGYRDYSSPLRTGPRMSHKGN